MLCTNCYRDAADGAVFCNHCGTHLQEICDNCDTLNPLDSRFCSRCGLSLSSGLQGAESPIYHQPPISSPVQSASCPRCQKVNEPGSAYCYSCGFPLDEVEISAQPLVPQSPQYSAQTGMEAQYPSQADTGQPAGFWIRLVAYVLDYIFVLVLFMGLFAIGFVFTEVSPDSSLAKSISSYGDEDAPIIEWLDIVGYIVGLIYFAIGIAAWSTTAGKRIFGLYVMRSDGSRVGFGRASVRYLCYFVSGLLLGIGFLMIAFSDDKRGLHDLICDTMVIRR